MRILPEETCGICIDMQAKLLPAMYNYQGVLHRTEFLLKGLRLFEIPVIISQQYTKGLGPSVEEIYEAAGTREYMDKTAFSCCRDAGIMDRFLEMGRGNVIVMGCETHVCVLQTCIDLKAAGFTPIIALDAVTSERKDDLDAGIIRAQQEGVLITSTEAILFELCGDSGSPQFREFSNLVKEKNKIIAQD